MTLRGHEGSVHFTDQLCYTCAMLIARTSLGDVEYRVAGQVPRTALVLLGGHVDAGAHLGDDYFLERGYRVIVVSRPGYGKTPLDTGTTPDGFADALCELLTELGVKQAVTVGISAGGRTAMRFAANCPTLVEKLVLQSAVSFAPWPDWKTKLGSYFAFNSFSEKYTWSLMRALLKRNPTAALKMMLSYMTTLDSAEVVNRLSKGSSHALIKLFSQMRSGRGFLNDLKMADRDATDVQVPTLIIHSKYDKSVSLDHPHLVASQIQDSRLYLPDAESHMLWFSSHYPVIKHVMDEFLDA